MIYQNNGSVKWFLMENHNFRELRSGDVFFCNEAKKIRERRNKVVESCEKVLSTIFDNLLIKFVII